MARTRKYTDEQIVTALKATRGLVYLAAARMKCDPSTIYDRSKVSVAVSAAMTTERGKVVDLAESGLFDALKAKEAWAIQFALKTLGKNRGYVERQETRDVTDEDIDAEINSEMARLAAGS